MIDKALKFISEEINNYLNSKLSPESTRIVLDNIAKLQDGGGNENKIILSLVNIEEDRLSKNPDNFYKTDDNKVVYKNAPVHLNLYCLFAYNHGVNDGGEDLNNQYEEALKHIAYVVQFFQHRNVFTPLNSPALDAGIEKLLMELNTLGFEQLNHLWAVLGGKYLPSVLYKMRLVVIDENLQTAAGELIKNVNVVEN
jgi:hypothetical protein